MAFANSIFFLYICSKLPKLSKMRKFILASIMCLFALTAFSQAHRHFKSVYTIVDTLSVKSVQSNYPTRDGDYLITLPKEQNFIVAYNNDHSKAIVLHGYPYAKRMEYNVKYEGTRQILWYKDEHIYCGYIYETHPPVSTTENMRFPHSHLPY